MEKGLVTVVLPIYNVEKYLNQCIESVVNQTYKNLEILLIDDGSPDNCPLICDEWAKKDGRIRVIHKKNRGLGMARNTGIEYATGEYICFFDSDDYIKPETIEKCFMKAAEEKADAVIFGLVSLSPEGEEKEDFRPKTGQITYIGESVRNEFLPEYIAPDPKGNGTRTFYMSSCLILYSLKLIKMSGWRFASEREIISEDVYSLLGFFSYVNTVTVLPESFYYYRINDNSLSRSYRKDRYKKIRHFYMECMKLCDKKGYSDEIKHRVSKPYLAFTNSAIKQECFVDRPYRETFNTIKEIIDDSVLQNVLKQNIDDNVSKTRRIFFFAMRHKLYRTCIALCRMKA